MTTPLRDTIKTTLALYDRLRRHNLIAIVASHDLTTSDELIEFCLQLLVEEGAIGMQHGVSKWDDEFFHIEQDDERDWLDWLWLEYAIGIYRLRMLCSRVRRAVTFWRKKK